MSTFTLQKSISLPHHVLEVKAIIIEDNLNYLRLNEGVRIEGKLLLSGDAVLEGKTVPFNDAIDVDVFVPNKRICEVRVLKLNVKDYKFRIEEKIVHFEINCILEGEEQLEETFSIEKKVKRPVRVPKTIKQDPLIESARGLMSEEEHDLLEQAILSKDCEVISTDENLEFPFKIIDESIELEIVKAELETDTAAINEQTDFRNKEIEDPLMLSVEQVTEEIPFREVKNEKIFDHENYTVFTRFYRVKDNETYASISLKFNLDVNLLVKRNNNKNLKEGVLIELNQ